VSTFAQADPDTQRRLLDERRQELTDPITREALAAFAEQGDDPRADLAVALVDLASDAGHTTLLAQAFTALQGHGTLTPVLRETGKAADTRPLAALATVAGHAADTEADAAEAAFYAAVAHTLADEPDQPDQSDQALAQLLAQARALSPASVNAWITELAQIGATHHRALTLIPLLVSPTKVPETGEGEETS
jgi:hypothetical protein